MKTKQVGLLTKIILGIPGFPFISVEIHKQIVLNFPPVEKNAELGFYLD